MDFKKEHLVIFLILVTEVLGFSLILPFLPLYAEQYGATPIVIGFLLTSFSFFQFISAPIMGKLSDHYGRRPLLMISQFSTFLGYMILGFSNAMWMIFLSRMVDGLFGSNFTIAQAYLSDISSEKDRSKAFGLIGAAFGTGFLIGPAIGGMLSKISYGLPAFIAAGFSLLTIILTYFILPETVKRQEHMKIDIKIFHLDDFKKYFANKGTSTALWEFFFFAMCHTIFVSQFALYAERQFGFDAEHIGYLLAYIGFVSVILRGALLSKLIDFFGERKLQFIGTVSAIAGNFISAFVTDWRLLLPAVTLFAFGMGTIRPVLTGAISRSVSPKEQGAIMGLTGSLTSLSQIIAPLIGGVLINYFFPGSVALAAALTMTIGLILMIRENKGMKWIRQA